MVVPLLSLLLLLLVASASGSKCTAMCFLKKDQRLGCALKSNLPSPADFSQPVRCVKKEYGTSTEVILGSSEVVDGLIPGGFDVFSLSEQTSSNPVPIQLTLNVKIKMVGPRVFTNVQNLQRLQLHPYDVHPCALYDLPKSVREVLLQCVGPKMKMLAPMRWPAGSPVRFKLNMCMQETRCYSCSRSVELRSQAKGPLALNKVVSLSECVTAASCVTDSAQCEAVTSTTMTTTRPPARRATEATSRQSSPATRRAEKRAPERAGPTRPKRPAETDFWSSKAKLEKGERRVNFLLLAVAGATVINSVLLLVILAVLFYAASCCCCRKKARGVFFISKENYPPEYSTLRPV